MRRIITAIAFALCGCTAYGQLTIDECWELARANYPLISRMGLIEQTEQYNLANASKGYLPQLQLTARASYQSDVVSLPIAIPGIDIPKLPKDQYDARLEVTQVIWDGGRIPSVRENIAAGTEVGRQSLEVELYTLKERVNQLFFGILLLDGQLEQNRITEDYLSSSHSRIGALVEGGLANRADLDAVQAEQITAMQNRLSMISLRQAYAHMLGVMIGRTEEELRITAPGVEDVQTENINRPELSLLDAQDAAYKAQLRSLASRNRPTLGAFAQGGYGQPGLNMLKSGFDSYYIIGVRLNWNFGSLYTKKNDRRIIENNRREVAAQRETFIFNTRLQLIGHRRQIDNLRELMRQDDRLVELRGNIRRAADAKVAGGTMSGTELMREVTAENLARQNRVLHRVQLLQAIYDLKTTIND